MKKLIITTLLIIIIPYFVVTLFIKDDQIKFKFVSNMNIRVKKQDNNIISVPFEDYILGVLAGEMPISFELEALKAQAVAARSYAMKKMEQNYNEDYDVVDTVMNQVYLDDIEYPEDGLDFKLYNLMKSKMITELNTENIDEVISKISDKILNKFTSAVRGLYKNED